jgi:hypothetical protein
LIERSTTSGRCHSGDDVTWTVLADPVLNEFCVLRCRDSSLNLRATKRRT